MKITAHPRRSAHGAFTLVEIMIVVAVISLLAAIAVPNFLRARKRTQAVRVLEDLRVLDYAIDRWALEKNKAVGDFAVFSDLQPYLKKDTVLSLEGKDLFGNVYGPQFPVDSLPYVPDPTFLALSDVAPAEFWSPYKR
jgi:prepilin-type N-terminal cleavage/methylation domain-containing protein